MNGITIKDDKVFCNDCGRWEWKESGKSIRHSSRCDTPQAQLMAPNPVTAEPSPYALQPGEDVYDRDFRLYKQGLISQSDAMNTDY